MRVTIAALICVCVAQSASTAELPLPPVVEPVPVPVKAPSRFLQQGIFFELGARYWLSSGTLSKDLFAVGGTGGLVSRLTYSGLHGHSAELFGSIKQIDGLFVKWNVGGGRIAAGKLIDEDFPPFVVPFSSTTSDQQEGSLGYATLDFGYNFVYSNTWQVGGFVGTHFFRESVNALGCVQTAGNPNICVPSFSGGVGITERADWWSARVGVSADWMPFDRFKLSANVAWVPFTRLESIDTHTLRPELLGGVSQNARGSGVQLEGIASYAFSDSFNVGVGARYWYMQAHGSVDFTAVGGTFQPVSFKTDRFGVFLQGAYTFGVPGRLRKSPWVACC